MTVPESPAWHGGRLVGRDRETAVLHRLLDEVAAGTPGVVEIVGEPGMGKTRLLVEVAGAARALGVRVITCGGARTAHRLGAAIVDMLDGHLAGLASQLLAELPGHRHALTVRTLLSRLMQLPPLVLAVDDVHTADDETLDLLDQFLRWPLAAPVLLILGVRPRQLPARLRRSLDDTPEVCRLQLTGLTAADVAMLIGRPSEEVGQLPFYRDSGGNPFYLKTLLTLPAPNQSGADLEYSDLLPAVRAAIAVELAALSPLARQTAHAAAVVGEPVEAYLLADVSDLPEQELSGAIDELVERDILRPGPDTCCFVFRHLVFRHLVYLDSPRGWRLGAHARADVALRSRQAPAIRRAAHLAYAAASDAAGVLAQAASAVARHQPETAARWLLAALRPATADASLTVEERTVLLHRLCQAVSHWRFGRDRGQILDETTRLLPDRPSSLRLTVAAVRAQLERMLRMPARARQYARAGLAAAYGDPPADKQVAATLTLELACAYLSHRYARQSRTHAQQSLAAARECGDRALQTCAAGVAMVAECLAGGFPENGEVTHAASALDTLLDSELVRRPDAALWIGIGYLLLDQPRDALRRLDRAIEIEAGADPNLTSLYLLTCRAIVLRAVGQLAAAGIDAVRADGLATASGSVELRAMTAALRAWLSAVTSDEEPAAESASLRADPSVESDLFATFERGMLAEARLAAGDHDGCLALLAAAGERDLSWVDPWSRVGWYELMTRAALRAHRYDEADQWAGQAQVVAAKLGTDGRAGLAALARAQVMAVGEPRAAASIAAQAADALDAAGLALDSARARAVAGSALASGGQLDRACEELAVAEAQFGVCGARRHEREVAEQRQRLGARMTRAKQPRSGVDALTARERQVAVLITQGMTNRQIAARLFVTERTVEMHVSRTFAKLGVLNRAGLVREMVLTEKAEQ